ncbi:phosphotransferase family protein [Nostocoides jenkinsii]|uniref:Aminoglycoside phosphotransferase domain-containing protein n=1 Tax=Nostocoides jenkinsii Ben 74 TaxID=1193518 RepID=A0A077MCB4_9MICO|nr:aminoglycoside phosphotransferase family protein [Tetrasphaera jenkinsii]CCI53495.1 hypothetical protein BN13_40047 [Tetrasphaera jenkinsii Ben 74]
MGPAPAQAAAAAHAAALDLGIDPATLTRTAAGSTSTVFLGSGIAVIVAAPGADLDDVSRRVDLAADLARDARFVRPRWDGARDVGGRVVTAWDLVPVDTGPVDWQSAGAALRALHAVSAGAYRDRHGLADLGSLADVSAGIERARECRRIPASAAVVLRRAVDRLTDEIAPHRRDLVVVHGDLHAPNLIHGRGGAVLCDTDEIGVGPAAYDLGMLLDPLRSAVPRASLGDFVRGYGAPLPPLPVRRSFARVAHLRRTVALLTVPASSAHARFYEAARLGAWQAMDRDWSADLVPVVALPPGRRARLAARRLRPF